MAGGDHVAAAWRRRRSVLTTYRQVLNAAGIEPETVLPDLAAAAVATACSRHGQWA